MTVARRDPEKADLVYGDVMVGREGRAGGTLMFYEHQRQRAGVPWMVCPGLSSGARTAQRRKRTVGSIPVIVAQTRC